MENGLFCMGIMPLQIRPHSLGLRWRSPLDSSHYLVSTCRLLCMRALLKMIPQYHTILTSLMFIRWAWLFGNCWWLEFSNHPILKTSFKLEKKLMLLALKTNISMWGKKWSFKTIAPSWSQTFWDWCLNKSKTKEDTLLKSVFVWI